MLRTPLGEIEVLLDGIPTEYHAEEIALGRACSELKGRFLITVEMPPDTRERRVSCCLRQHVPAENDCIEAGRNLEAKSFYKGRGKLTIAMEGDVGHEELYRAEYLPGGVQYRLYPSAKSITLDFGIAWLDALTNENELQTWIGADPSALHQAEKKERPCREKDRILYDVDFQDDFPALEGALYESSRGVGSVERWEPFPQESRETMVHSICEIGQEETQDRLLHLTLNYHRTRIDPQDVEDEPAQHHAEQVILDRTEHALTYHFKKADQEFSGKYIHPEWIEFIFAALERDGFPQRRPDSITDVLEQQPIDPTYSLSAYYANRGKYTICGRLDQLGAPQGYDQFARRLRNFWAYLESSEMIGYDLYTYMPRRASDLKFCKVWVDKVPGRLYTYLCELPEIQKDSWVLVPFGKDNTVEVGCVECVEYAQPENAPYPIERTKCILKECTQKDLADRVEQERALNPYAARYFKPGKAEACHRCPLLGREIYWGGRGGCFDVKCTFGGSHKFMDHFETSFDPEYAEQICEECGWREMDEEE